jgi:hypothetical protein
MLESGPDLGQFQNEACHGFFAGEALGIDQLLWLWAGGET